MKSNSAYISKNFKYQINSKNYVEYLKALKNINTRIICENRYGSLLSITQLLLNFLDFRLFFRVDLHFYA